MKRIVAVAMTLIGLTAVAVVPGEWNSDFGTSLAYAEKYHLPIVVVWGNTSCHYCDELEAVFQDEGLTSWTSKHSILMVSKSEAIDSQESDNLAAKEWIKSLSNVSSYPFVGVYWKKPDGTVACSTAFVGRKGMMPATSPSDDLAGQLANSLDQLVGDYYPIADAGYHTNTVDGVEWVFAVKDGEAVIKNSESWKSAIPTSTKGTLEIPAILGGCPVTEIGDHALYNCNGLTEVTIPAGVRSVGKYAFSGCYRMVRITIPSSMLNINSTAFGSCPMLEAFEVGEENLVYKSQDGFLLSKDGEELVCAVKGDGVIPSTVTRIGDHAFYGQYYLKSVSFPVGVTNIGEYAFASCSTLENVTIPEGVVNIADNTFTSCHALTNVTISSSVVRIGESAFSSSGLQHLTIPDGVTTIGRSAFMGCSSLRNVDIPANVTNIVNDAFAFCGNLTAFIVDEANPNYKSEDGFLLTKDGQTLVCGVNGDVEIPYGVTKIGGAAFEGLAGLRSVTIPSSVNVISYYAFSYCRGLTSITIPASVAQIGSDVFNGCTALDEVAFEGAPPSGLSNSKIKVDAEIRYNEAYANEWLPVIEACGFTNATSYTLAAATSDGGPYTNVVNSIQWVFTVSGGEASVGSGVYGETAIPQEIIGEIVIPSTLGGCPVTGIGDSAFRYCTSLTHVTIPDGVQSIGVQAFEECSGLQSVDMPDSLECIQGYAFYGCRALTEAELPAALCSIGYAAFAQCAALQSICLPQSIEYVSIGAFAGCNASVEIDESCAFCASTYCVVDDMLFDSEMTRLVYCPTGKSGDVNIPYGVEEFDFSSCSNITSITLPKTVAYIPYWSLGGCSSLMEINIPRGVRGIGSYAFCGCSALSTITLPSSVTDIEASAFWGCSGLKTMTIPWSVSSLGEGVFQWCDNLYAVDFECAPPSGVVSAAIPQDAIIRYNQEYEEEWLPVIEECGFTNASPYLPAKPDGGPYEEDVDGIVWTYTVYDGEATIESVDPAADALVVPEMLGGRTVTGLSDYAFYDCSEVASITLHRHIASVGCETFHYCSGLTQIEVDAENPYFKSGNGLLLDKSGQSVVAGVNGVVTIPDGVTRIEENAFLGCGNLTSVTVPSSVAYVANGAFGGCEALTNILFEGSMPRCGQFAFSDRDNPDCDSQNLTIHTTADPLSCAYISGVPVVFDNYKSQPTTQTIVVTNVIVHYVVNSRTSDSVIPDTTAGIVNIVAEIDSSKAVAITEDWAAQYPNFASTFDSDFSKALTMPTGKKDGAGNAMLVWQDYVAGTDPTKKDDVFTASITFDKDTGKPVISWSPELTAAEAAKREYKKYGKVKLTDEWVEISDATAENYNFFKVSVGMKK